jgi:hypothetical protein
MLKLCMLICLFNDACKVSIGERHDGLQELIGCWYFTVSGTCGWVAHVYGTAGGERDFSIGVDEDEGGGVLGKVEWC